jgi:ferredoxin
MDLTLPKAKTTPLENKQEDLVIIGVPVYEGRVAKTAITRLQQLKADKTPAVVVVLYGNRDFEDALLELGDLAGDLGFIPIAGGAFIGEHSFATKTRPMANGRPDEQDLAKAREFGAGILAKLEKLGSWDDVVRIDLPGNTPYIFRDRSPLADRAATTMAETCTLCGTCAELCPVGAITIEDTVLTDNLACTLCCACVKGCPTDSRVVDDPTVNKIANWVSKNFQARREPETFL